MADALTTATLAIYIVLLFPILYVLIKHRKANFLGWLFLALFCMIRIVGSALALTRTSAAASIISNVGLSPILFATAHILHEARIFRVRNLDPKHEYVFELFFHIIVVAGVALTAAGSSKLQSGHLDPEKVTKVEAMVKAGIAILAVSWGVLVLWTGVSVAAPKRTGAAVRGGSILLTSISISLVFIGIRVFYSLTALVTEEKSLRPTSGSMAIRVVLSFLPELIATLVYIGAGVVTKDTADLARDEGGKWEMARKESPQPSV